MVLVTNNDLNKNYFFTWEEIKHGVAQGLILDPLLFLLYTYDLTRTINDKNTPRLFADDTNI
jgi:hypothetical protein